ncbi:MAG TPA: TlpA disulfide reductase family protein [Terriglobia bacterium]|nr:TlpA disulfide reductase family protein [Terriglobia bacterium]
MHSWIALSLTALLFQAPSAEQRIIDYLKANVKPGRQVVVSELYNNVFKTPEERKVLDRLFNTFFKIPMFIVQYNATSKKIPTLRELSEQFNFTIPGEADVLLRIMEADPRVPKFIERNPRTGEITKVDIAKIQASPQFGKVLERSITGWEGREAPPFSITAYDGKTVTSQQISGQPHLIYFWFTNCPPCVRSSPILAELYNQYAARGFKIIGANADRFLELSYDDKVRADYVKQYGFKFTTAHLNTQMQQAYGGVSVFPTMFFVDKKGTIVKQFVNFQEKAVLDQAIQATLK